MKRYLYILLAICTLSFAACGGDDNNSVIPGGGENPGGGEVGGITAAELDANSFALDGEVVALGSVAAMMVDENLSVVATPQSGVTSAEAILECEEFLFASVSPLLVGRKFNLITESSLYTFVSTLAGAGLETVAPEFTEEIEAGTAIFTYQGNELDVKADLTLVGGVSFSFHIQTTIEADVNESVIVSIYGEKPLRTAFYLKEGGYTYLYFTPAGLYYFDELSIATWYLYLVVDDSLVSGQTLDITSVGEDTTLFFGMVDNFDEGNSFEVASGHLEGATGTINISERGEGDYTAVIDIVFGGNSYSVNFAGECLSALDEEPESGNVLLYNGEELGVTGVSLTKGESVWSLIFDVEDGTTLTATAPATFFDGNARGFSQSADLTVSYQGVTYSKANGHSGTFTALYNEQDATLSLSFTNYDNLELNYSGSVTIN